MFVECEKFPGSQAVRAVRPTWKHPALAGIALGSLLAGFGGGVLAMRRAEPAVTPAVSPASTGTSTPSLAAAPGERSIRREHRVEAARARTAPPPTKRESMTGPAARARTASGVPMQSHAAPIVRAYGNSAGAGTPPGVVKIVIPPTILAPRTSTAAEAR